MALPLVSFWNPGEEPFLLRTSFQEGRKVQHETLANFSAQPEAAVETIKASLTGKTLVEAGHACLFGDVIETYRKLPENQVGNLTVVTHTVGYSALNHVG